MRKKIDENTILKNLLESNESKFVELFLFYHKSLIGKNEIIKVNKKLNKKYRPSKSEINNDKRYLNTIYLKWLKLIKKTNHSCQFKQRLAKEYRDEIKRRSLNKYLFFRRDKDNLKVLVLRAKYHFLTINEIFKLTEKKNLEVNFKTEKIYIDEEFLIHVFNRHYCETTNPNPEKSYHYEDISPFELIEFFNRIFRWIKNQENLNFEIDKVIYFNYKNNIYKLYIENSTVQKKGDGNISIKRFSSIFRLEDENELTNIKNNYDLYKINSEFGIYIKK